MQERIDAIMQRWNAGLNLSPDQQSKLLTIVTARENEMQEVRKQHRAEDNKELRQVKVEEVRKKYGPKMTTLLNDQQATQLKQLRKQWKAERID